MESETLKRQFAKLENRCLGERRFDYNVPRTINKQNELLKQAPKIKVRKATQKQRFTMKTAGTATSVRRYKVEFRKDVREVLQVSQNHMNTLRARRQAVRENEDSMLAARNGKHGMILTDEDGNAVSRGDLDGFEDREGEEEERGPEDDVDDDSILTAAQFRQVRQAQSAKELQQMRQQAHTSPSSRSSNAWGSSASVVNADAVARTARNEGYFMALSEYHSSKMRSSKQETQARAVEGQASGSAEDEDGEDDWDDESEDEDEEKTNAPHVGPFSDFFAHYHDERMVPLSLGIAQGVCAHISAAADAAAKGNDGGSDGTTETIAMSSGLGGLFASSSQSSFSHVQGKKDRVTFGASSSSTGRTRADLRLDIDGNSSSSHVRQDEDSALANDTSMEVVDLSCFGIGDRYGQALSKGLKQLGELQGAEPKSGGKLPMQRMQKQRSNLPTALLQKKPIQQTTAQTNAKVKELRLRQNRLTDSSMTPLLQGIEKLGSIAAADLSQNLFGIRSVTLLRGILQDSNCRLHTLVLDQCRLGSNGGGAETLGLLLNAQGTTSGRTGGAAVAAFQEKAQAAAASAVADRPSSTNGATTASVNSQGNSDSAGGAGGGTAAAAAAGSESAGSTGCAPSRVPWMTSLADALSTNRSVTRLSLQRNEIGSDGAEQLARALVSNGSLASLDLSWNNIRGVGARKLGLALACANETVSDLSLAFNSLGSSLGTEATRRRICIELDPPESMKRELEAKKKAAEEKDAKKGKKGKGKDKGKEKGKGKEKAKQKGGGGEEDVEAERSKWECWHENRKAQVQELRRCKATATGRGAGAAEVRRILGVNEIEAAEKAAIEVAFQAREKAKKEAEKAKKGGDKKKQAPAGKKKGPTPKGPPPPDPELDQYRLGSSAIEWAAVLVMNESLTHLDISHNAFDQLDCELLAEGVLNNRSLIGMHMTGNSAVVDHKGFIMPVDPKVLELSQLKLPVPTAEEKEAVERLRREKAAKEAAAKAAALKVAAEKAAADAAKAAAEKAAKKGKKGKSGKTGKVSAKEAKRREKQRVKDEEAAEELAVLQIKNDEAFAKLKLMTAARSVEREKRLAMEVKGHFGLLHVSIDGAIAADGTGGGMITSDEQACCWRCHGYREHRFHAPPPPELMNELHIGFGDGAGYKKPMTMAERAHLLKTTPPPTIHLMCDGWRADVMEWDAVDGCYACYRMLPPGIHRYYFTSPLTGARWYNPIEPHSKLSGLPVPVCNTLQFTLQDQLEAGRPGRGSVGFGDVPLTMVRFDPDGGAPGNAAAKRGTKRPKASTPAGAASQQLQFDFALPRERGWACAGTGAGTAVGASAGSTCTAAANGPKLVSAPLPHEAMLLTEDEKWILVPHSVHGGSALGVASPRLSGIAGRGASPRLSGIAGRSGSPPTPTGGPPSRSGSVLTGGAETGAGSLELQAGDKVTVVKQGDPAHGQTAVVVLSTVQPAADGSKNGVTKKVEVMLQSEKSASYLASELEREVSGTVPPLLISGGVARVNSVSRLREPGPDSARRWSRMSSDSNFRRQSSMRNPAAAGAYPDAQLVAQTKVAVKCEDCGKKTGNLATHFCKHPKCGKKRCDSCSCEEHQLVILHTKANMKPPPIPIQAKEDPKASKIGKKKVTEEAPFSSKYVEQKGSACVCDSCGLTPTVHMVMCKHSQCAGKVTCVNCFDSDHGWAWSLLKNDRVWRGRLLRQRAKQRVKNIIRQGVELVNALEHKSFKEAKHPNETNGLRVTTERARAGGGASGAATKLARSPGRTGSLGADTKADRSAASVREDQDAFGSYLEQPHSYTAGLERDWARMVKKGSVRQLVERWSQLVESDPANPGRGGTGTHDDEMDHVKAVFLSRYPQLVHLFRYLCATPCVQYAQALAGKTSQPSTPTSNTRKVFEKQSSSLAEDVEQELDDIDGSNTNRSNRSSGRRTPTPSAVIAATAAAAAATKDPAWSLLQVGPNAAGPFSVPVEQWLWLCERCELVDEGEESSFTNREAIVQIFTTANRVGGGGTGLNAESSGKRDQYEVAHNSPKHLVRSEFLEALLRIAVNLYVRERNETSLPSSALEVLLDVDVFPSCARSSIDLSAHRRFNANVSDYAGREAVERWGDHDSNIFRRDQCYTQDIELVLFVHRNALKVIFERFAQSSESANKSDDNAPKASTPTAAAPRRIGKAAGKRGRSRHTIAQVKSSSPENVGGEQAKKPGAKSAKSAKGTKTGPLIRHRKVKDREMEFKMTVAQWLRLLHDAMLLSPEADVEAQYQRQHARSHHIDNGDAGSDTPPPRARRNRDNTGNLGGGISLMQAQLAFVCAKLFVADDMGSYHEASHLSFEDFMEALCYLVGHFLTDLPIDGDGLGDAMRDVSLAEKLSVLLKHLLALQLHFS
jgi:Ran GTPase-activating protein (RanGAP) involved in mRNA processing and transport